jgi:SAM-dependent methyltransferase
MLASGLLQIITHARYKSIAELGAAPNGPRILDTDCYSPIFQLLRNAHFYSASVYLPEKPFGTTIYPKVINADLEQMPFPDRSFDVILTSDVMEHVRRDDLAHAEIYRCLKPSGYYVFTVPFVPSWKKNEVRVKTRGDQDIYLMEKQYHGDPVTGRGILVYRIYGNELIEQLRNLGFEVRLDNRADENAGMPTKDLFICRKAL